MRGEPRVDTTVIGAARLASGVLIIAALVYTYGLRIGVGDSSPFDYFGYFTNQTSLLAGIIMIVTGSLTLARRTSPPVLGLLRGIATAYLLVVAVIYNLLVPGTGSASPWVSFLLHVLFPLYVALDWLLVGDRPRLRWRSLWALFPYPAVWLGSSCSAVRRMAGFPTGSCCRNAAPPRSSRTSSGWSSLSPSRDRSCGE